MEIGKFADVDVRLFVELKGEKTDINAADAAGFTRRKRRI